MELRELRVLRLPGIEHPFTLTAAPGLNLVLGPNGSGKSSLCRAALGLLWPGRHDGGQVVARWEDAGSEWLSERAGGDRVTWEQAGRQSGPPDLPSASLAGAFHLGVLDILKATADQDDDALAQAVRRQMSGGYDLAGLLERDAIAAKAGLHEKRELDQREQDLKQKQQAQRALFSQEQGLDDLRARYQAAQQASDRARALAVARDLVEARARASGLSGQIAARFPTNLADVRPDHLERLTRLRDRQRELDDALTATRRDLAIATDDLAATGLTDPTVDPGVLGATREALARARTQAEAISSLADDLAAAEAATDTAKRDLAAWGDVRDRAALDPDALRASVRRVQELLTATACQDGLARLAAHEELNVPATADDRGPAAIVAARHAAVAWLRASAERRWSWPAVPGAVALLVAGGLSLAWRDDPLGWAWLGLGAGVLGWFLIQGRHRPATRRAVDDHRASGLEDPAAWEAGAVERHLDQLLQREVDLAHEKRRRALRQRLEADLAAARFALEPLQHQSGGDPAERADLVELDRRLAVHQQARLERERVRGRLDRARTELDATLATVHQALSPWLAGSDASDIGEALTLPILGASLDDLGRRATAHADATERQTAARRHLGDLEQRRTEALAEAADLLASVGLPADGDQQLRQWTEALPAYTELADQAREASTAVRLQEDNLAQLTADLRAIADAACGSPPEQLRDRLADAEDIAASRDDLQREILVIEERLDAAIRAVDHERAIAERDLARDRLADVRDATRDRALRRLLLERLRRQHHRLAEPPVVARARQLFAGFTHGAHELLIPTDEGEPYRARDTRSGRGLALSQLSDGTRAQLLLAARLAHVAEAERGVRLPLFLDESLTASDPARFDAVASALLDLVEREGRQLIYLTCDPADVDAWQRLLAARGHDPAPVTDLALLRGQAAAAPAARLRDSRPLPPAPSTGEDAADYAARLNVPRLDPHAPADAAHVAYVLDDDLTLVHQLLCRGAERLGQVVTLASVLAVEGLLDDDALASLLARRAALGEFLDAFATGRGRPAPRGILNEQSEVKTSKLTEVDTLLADLDGDAAALRDALASGRVSRLREDKQDELLDWLSQEGYLDTRPRLSSDEVATRVLQAGQEDIRRRTVGVPTLRRLVDRWWAAAGGGDG